MTVTGKIRIGQLASELRAHAEIFRGALDVRASDINDEMKIASARALAALVSEEELCADYILPKAFDPRVKDAVASAAADAARRSGVARKP